MDETIILKAVPRSGTPGAIRRAHRVPVVAYGSDFSTLALEIDEVSLVRAYRSAGHSSVVKLEIDGKQQGALIQEIVRHPVKSRIIHADFRLVKMDEAIRAEIVVKPVGESPAVKNLGGILLQPLEEIEVEGKPGDLVSEIEVDISGLEEIHASIHAGAVSLPQGLTLITDESETIFTIGVPGGGESSEDTETPEEGEAEGGEEKKEEKSE